MNWDEQVSRMKADSIERRARLREEFPEDAKWIDEMRRAFPGAVFKNWTVDDKPV
jgi:hypothetical protein